MHPRTLHEVTASNLGLAAEIFVGQSATHGALNRADRQANAGRYARGEKAFFRYHVAAKVDEILRVQQPVLVCMDDVLPHVRCTIDQRAVAGDELGTMLMEENRRGRIARHLEPFRSALTSSTHELASMATTALRQTKAYETGQGKDIAQLVLETAALIRTTLCNIITQGRMNEQPAYIGLGSYAGNHMADSTAALMMRAMLREQAQILPHATALAAQPFIKIYALQSNIQALVQQILVARDILRDSTEDALGAARLQKMAPALAELEWRRALPTAPAADNSVAALVSERALGTMGYLLHQPGERELVRVTSPSQANDARFALVCDVPCVTPQCPYAGLPEGKLVDEAVTRTLQGLRGELDGILERLPLVRANMRQLGNLEFHTIYNDPEAFEISVEAALEPILNGLMPISLRRLDEETADDESDATDEMPAEAAVVETVCARQLQFGKFDHFLQALGMQKLPSEGKGSHTKYRNPLSDRFCTITHRYSQSHTRPVPRGIVKASLNDLALTAEQISRANALLASIS